MLAFNMTIIRTDGMPEYFAKQKSMVSAKNGSLHIDEFGGVSCLRVEYTRSVYIAARCSIHSQSEMRI